MTDAERMAAIRASVGPDGYCYICWVADCDHHFFFVSLAAVERERDEWRAKYLKAASERDNGHGALLTAGRRVGELEATIRWAADNLHHGSDHTQDWLAQLIADHLDKALLAARPEGEVTT